MKMGGESTQSLALAVMRSAATNFFSLGTEIPPGLEARRIRLWHTDLARWESVTAPPPF